MILIIRFYSNSHGNVAGNILNMQQFSYISPQNIQISLSSTLGTTQPQLNTQYNLNSIEFVPSNINSSLFRFRFTVKNGTIKLRRDIDIEGGSAPTPAMHSIIIEPLNASMPCEFEISAIPCFTASSSLSLIKNTIAKYNITQSVNKEVNFHAGINDLIYDLNKEYDIGLQIPQALQDNITSLQNTQGTMTQNITSLQNAQGTMTQNITSLQTSITKETENIKKLNSWATALITSLTKYFGGSKINTEKLK